MTVAGIIAEYNPLHHGHLWHIKQTRRILGEDTPIIAVMSGHTVQRGEFPIFTKYARAEMAARAGIDLVIELPAPWSCACAERFAWGGLSLLARLGIITHLSFGSECASIEELTKLALYIPEEYPKGLSLARVYPELFPDNAALYTPNNILAIEYIRAIKAIAPQITPLAIKRVKGCHDDDVSSAMALRRLLLAGKRIDIPNFELLDRELAKGFAPITMQRNELGILSYLRRLTPEQWAVIPEMSGGFHHRLANAARSARSLEELYTMVKTKRFTHSRIRRAVLCAFLGITPANVPPRLRLLAIGKMGPFLLSHIKAHIISRPASHKSELKQESDITDQLALCFPKAHRGGLEWSNGVYILKTGQTIF